MIAIYTYIQKYIYTYILINSTPRFLLLGTLYHLNSAVFVSAPRASLWKLFVYRNALWGDPRKRGRKYFAETKNGEKRTGFIKRLFA